MYLMEQSFIRKQVFFKIDSKKQNFTHWVKLMTLKWNYEIITIKLQLNYNFVSFNQCMMS